MGLATAEGAATATTVTFSGALKGLGATLMSNPIVLITTALTAGISIWNAYRQSVEETIQKAKDASNAWKESTSSLDEQISKYKELKADGFFDGTKLYQKAIEKRVKRDYISLVHEGVFYILQEDMVMIGGLIMICFFALIIPYQLKQRLRQVIPIMATTKTGRRIYQIQLIASALAALFVGIIQMAVYGIIWHLKGLSVFWRCESWGIASNSYWCDKLSFGTYMLLYMALILLFAIASIVIIDFIGRTIGNYMGAVAVSIPVCGAMMFLMRKIYYMLFLITNDQVLAYWELYALATWLIVMLLFYKIRSKRWKKVDL